MMDFWTAELEFLRGLQSFHTPWLDQVMTLLTGLADHGMIWILLGAAFLCVPRTKKMGLAVLISLAVGLLLGNVLLKNIVARPRPCWIDTGVALLVGNPRDFSFPSGHTLASFEGAVSIFLFHRKAGLIALALAALIAFSRLYLFVHFPTDVLAGAVMGTLIALGVNRWIKRQTEGPKENGAQAES